MFSNQKIVLKYDIYLKAKGLDAQILLIFVNENCHAWSGPGWSKEILSLT
jgi:hypothetical protein